MTFWQPIVDFQGDRGVYAATRIFTDRNEALEHANDLREKFRSDEGVSFERVLSTDDIKVRADPLTYYTEA